MVDSTGFGRDPVPLRLVYRDELRNYTEDMVAMAELARESMRHASQALAEQDLEAAEGAMTESDALGDIHRRCEDRALQLLARETPVATELRQVLAYIHVGQDLMRMSSLAKSVSKIARQYHPSPTLPADIVPLVMDMAKAADTMAERVCAMITDGTQELSLDDADDVIDTISAELTDAAKSEAWQYTNCHAVDTALISRFYERFADHCVSIARQLTFIATAER